jgi:CMP-N,N'-diacetyllegionaminic acid synthase
VIPARGGSKGIPGKNIKRLGGLPLIAWTIREAKKAKLIDRVVVSTEDKKIAAVARKFGAEVPFLRPKALSRDSTPGIEPVLHACRELPDYQEIICLQPTSPLRSSGDIDRLVTFARKRRASSVLSLCPATKHPAWSFALTPGRRLKPFVRFGFAQLRQKLSQAFSLNGAIYYAKRSWLLKNKTFLSSGTLGFVMPKERSVDIDDWYDWKIAERLRK